jgi:hypothetical protein
MYAMQVESSLLLAAKVSWWQDPTLLAIIAIIGFAFGFVGVIGAVVTALAYRGQQRTEHAFDEILTRATRDWKGEYTEQQIKTMTKEVKNLTDQIQREIPLEARRVFLLEQANVLGQTISELYSQYGLVLTTLGTTRSEDLNPTLSSEIERDIMPAYLRARRRRRLVIAIVAVLVVATVLVLLNPLGTFVLGRYFAQSMGLYTFQIEFWVEGTYIYIVSAALLIGLLMLVPTNLFPKSKRWRWLTIVILAVAWIVTLMAAIVLPLSFVDVALTVASCVLLALSCRSLISAYV